MKQLLLILLSLAIISSVQNSPQFEIVNVSHSQYFYVGNITETTVLFKSNQEIYLINSSMNCKFFPQPISYSSKESNQTFNGEFAIHYNIVIPEYIAIGLFNYSFRIHYIKDNIQNVWVSNKTESEVFDYYIYNYFELEERVISKLENTRYVSDQGFEYAKQAVNELNTASRYEFTAKGIYHLKRALYYISLADEAEEQYYLQLEKKRARDQTIQLIFVTVLITGIMAAFYITHRQKKSAIRKLRRTHNKRDHNRREK